MYKKLLAYLLFFILFVISTNSAFAIDGTLRVTSPNGGESYKEGDTVTITWEASSNIDSMYLGYSFGPGSLNWIATSIPNTGSYTWNVNVGNTTNTQIWLDITGYDTGVGSLSDRSDSAFTVEQNPPLNTSSPSNNPNSGSSNSLRKITLPTPTPTPVPTPRPTPIPLTIKNISWSETFIFDGSQTTDLSKLSNLKQVEGFTLDTLQGFLFVFEEVLDLTTRNDLNALIKVEDYWIVESWSFWIKWEWWETYKIDEPIKVTLTNEELTGYTPIIEAKNSEKGEYRVVENKPGSVTLEVKGGDEVEIKPQVALTATDSQTVTSANVTLEGKTSHKDLNFFAKVNGEEMPLSVNINQELGDWTANIDGLVKGANFIEVFYEFEGNKTSFGETTVYSQPKFWQDIPREYVYGGLNVVLVAGILIYKLVPTLRQKLRR